MIARDKKGGPFQLWCVNHPEGEHGKSTMVHRGSLDLASSNAPELTVYTCKACGYAELYVNAALASVVGE